MDTSLTHINEKGEMNIVDISNKNESEREALAEGYISLNKNILEKIKNSYDFIIIDCAPSLGIVTTNALTAANSIIIPV